MTNSRENYAANIGQFARIIAVAGRPANLAKVLAPVTRPAPDPPAAPSAGIRVRRWQDILVAERGLSAEWEAAYPNWNSNTSGLSDEQKRDHVAPYARVIENLSLEHNGWSRALDFLFNEAETCFTELRLAAEGHRVPARTTEVVRGFVPSFDEFVFHGRRAKPATLEGMRKTPAREQKVQLASNIRALLKPFDKDDRRIITSRVNTGAIYRYSAIDVDARTMLGAIIDAMAMLLSEPAVRGFVLDDYARASAVQRIATSMTLIELLPMTEKGRVYLRSVPSGTEYLHLNSPVHPKQLTEMVEGFHWDEATFEFQLMDTAAIWVGEGALAEIAESLGLAFVGGVKPITKSYLTILSTLRLLECMEAFELKGAGFVQSMVILHQRHAELPKSPPASRGMVVARAINAFLAMWDWAEKSVAMANNNDPSSEDWLAYAKASNKVITDMVKFLEVLDDHKLGRLTASVGGGFDDAAHFIRKMDDYTLGKAEAKYMYRALNHIALVASIVEMLFEIHNAMRADRWQQAVVHGLLATSAGLQALQIFIGVLFRTPHPGAFLLGIAALFLTAIAQGIKSWLVKDDISIILGATYFGSKEGQRSASERWAYWHGPDAAASAFENVGSTFVLGATEAVAFEDWERQIAGVLGLMGAYDLIIKDGSVTPLSFVSSRLTTGFSPTVNTSTDPAKAASALPPGSRVEILDATRGRPLASRFEVGAGNPLLPVTLTPNGSPPSGDAADTSAKLRTALDGVLKNEAGANIPRVQTFSGLRGLQGGARELEIELTIPLPAWPGAATPGGNVIPARVIRRKAAP